MLPEVWRFVEKALRSEGDSSSLFVLKEDCTSFPPRELGKLKLLGLPDAAIPSELAKILSPESITITDSLVCLSRARTIFR